jgi:hypothetical protein
MAKVKGPALLMHRYTGKIGGYEPWDGISSWHDRVFSACPVCGIGLAHPIDRPMAHAKCIEASMVKVEVPRG